VILTAIAIPGAAIVGLGRREDERGLLARARCGRELEAPGLPAARTAPEPLEPT
jgi:hypothetical protein